MIVDKISLSILLLLTACVGSGNGSVNNKDDMPRSIMSAIDCGHVAKQPSLKLLRTHEEKTAVMSQMPVVGGDNSISQKLVLSQNEMLLQVNMGRKPTGGYALKLLQDESIVDDGWVNITVKWITPAQGMMLTQALTSPCLFVAIPKRKYKGIRILDQVGAVRLQTNL